jgi:hypothetical protein
MAAKFDLAQATTKPDQGAQLFVLYGREGVGKTWFLCTITQLFIIALEKLKGIVNPAPHFPTQPASFRDLLEAIDAFEQGNAKGADGKRPYLHLGIDSTTHLERLIHEAARVEENTTNLRANYSEAKGRVESLWDQLFRRLEVLRARTGVHVWLVAHGHQIDEAAHDGSTWKKWDLRLEKHAAPLVRSAADHVFFLEQAVVVEKAKGKRAVGKDRGRVIRTREVPGYFAKSKSGVPDTVPATWTDLRKALAAGAAPTKVRGRIDELVKGLSPEDAATVAAELETRPLTEVLAHVQSLLAVQSEESADAPPIDAAEPTPEPPAQTEPVAPPATTPEVAEEAAADEITSAKLPLDRARELVEGVRRDASTMAAAMREIAGLELPTSMRDAFVAELRKAASRAA